jgi:hypothetical protein
VPPGLREIRVGVADGQDSDVVVTEQGTASVQAGQVLLSAAGHQREVLARSGADPVAVAGMAEVGVAVDEGEPEAPATPQGRSGAEQDAAVAAQDDGQLSRIQQGAAPGGRAAAVGGQLRSVEDPVALLPAAAAIAGGVTQPASRAPVPASRPWSHSAPASL